MPQDLTLERLREVLRYEPDTGNFYWQVRTSNRVKLGAVAGARVDAERAYVRIAVDGVFYYAHRLAWFYMHGEWPSKDIDHLNGDKSDNRISNLRAVDRATNMENFRRVVRNTKAGLLGASPERKRYAANIHVGGKTKRIGTFDTPEEAHQAYLEVKRKLHKGNTL